MDVSHASDTVSSMPDTVARGVQVRDVRVALGAAPVLRGVQLDVAPGEHLAILGPSGCGKTTLLRVLAGLERIDEGEVWLGEERVAGKGLHLPAESRRVGLVFQDWALFPHLTVAENVAYGLPRHQRGRFLRRGRGPIHENVSALLEMVDVAELADRLPGSLSGGQQQRVALARALAPKPSVLLLDEPFSSLDTKLRADVRGDVAQLLRDLDVTALFVTHDQDEAFVLGDEVAVMRNGVVVQQATPTDLYSRPADPWLAEFVGAADLVAGIASGGEATTILGTVPLDAVAHGEVQVLVRPEHVILRDPFPSNSDLGVGSGGPTTGVVLEVEYHGHDALSTVRLADGSLVRSRATGRPRFAAGEQVVVGHSGASSIAYSTADVASVSSPPSQLV